jgi:hypothetical protein
MTVGRIIPNDLTGGQLSSCEVALYQRRRKAFVLPLSPPSGDRRLNKKLTAFMEMESVIRTYAEWFHALAGRLKIAASLDRG